MILVSVAVVGLLLVVAGIRLLNPRSNGSRPDQARPGPVLLIPGYGGSPAALSQLAGRLAGALGLAIDRAPDRSLEKHERDRQNAGQIALVQKPQSGQPRADDQLQSPGG